MYSAKRKLPEAELLISFPFLKTPPYLQGRVLCYALYFYPCLHITFHKLPVGIPILVVKGSYLVTIELIFLSSQLALFPTMYQVWPCVLSMCSFHCTVNFHL